MQFISKRTLKFCVLVTFSIFWKSACATILRNFNEAREWSFLRSSITVFPTQSIFWNVRGWKTLSIFMYSILLCVDVGLFSLLATLPSKVTIAESWGLLHFHGILSISGSFLFRKCFEMQEEKTISVVYFFSAFFLHECEIRIFSFLYDVNFIWKRQQNYIFLDRFKRIT